MRFFTQNRHGVRLTALLAAALLVFSCLGGCAADQSQLDGDYTVGAFVAQYGAVSYRPEDGSAFGTVTLSGDSLTCAGGSMRFQSKTRTVWEMTAEEALAVLSDDTSLLMPMEAFSAACEAAESVTVYTYYSGEDADGAYYAVWCFDGEPTWFAERTQLRLYELVRTK